jgi:tetratricopeptide (TPR) repeat protein
VNRPAAVSVSNDRIVNTVYAPIVIAAVAFLVYFVNVRPMLAGSALIDAMNQQQGGITQNLDLFKKAISYNTFANPEIREQLAQITSSVIGSDSVDAATKQAFFDFTKSELEKQVMLTPDDARYEVFFGSFLDRTGQYADAIPYLEKAVALSPKKQTMLYELGSDYLNAGQPDKALAQFKTAYEAYPQNDEARAIYALGAIYANKLDLADSILKDATTAVLTDSRLIQAYLATKQNAKAVALARRLVDMDPNNTEYHMNLAAVLYQTGNSSAAIAEVRKVIQLNPSFKDQGEAIIKDIQSGKK